MSIVHIIGAGVSGLSAGVALAEAGYTVEIYEAAGFAGGRCRSYFDPKLKIMLDNGNHLLMGANTHALEYLQKIGTLKQCITAPRARYSFTDLHTRKHWHALPPSRFPGIPWYEWLHLTKLFFAKPQDTVSACIPKHTALHLRLVEPLVTAALNTSTDRASALLFRQMLQTFLTGGKAAWRYFVPGRALSDIFIHPALNIITKKGGNLHLQTAVQKLDWNEHSITALHLNNQMIAIQENDVVICATSAHVAQQLLPQSVPHFTYSPIVNAHFLWKQAGKFRDALPLLGTIHGQAQWIFFHDGRISTTTSAAHTLVNEPEEKIAQILWDDICRALYLEAPLPPYRIIKEKRATIEATPENIQKRPFSTTAYANLLLAGDYLASPYPATLEAATYSGKEVAALALHHLKKH